MKKLAAALVALTLISANSVFAATPAEREAAKFENVLAASAKAKSINEKNIVVAQPVRPCVNSAKHAEVKKAHGKKAAKKAVVKKAPAKAAKVKKAHGKKAAKKAVEKKAEEAKPASTKAE